MQIITPVILSGGSGSRLWPLSRSKFPKQFWSLFREETLMQGTVERFSSHKNYGNIVVICNEQHRFLIAEQLKKISVAPKNIVLEPEGKNTAAAVVTACLLHNPDDIIIIVPSDHFIKDTSRFHDLVAMAAPIANSGKILTFGVIPSFPSTAYGYIQKGENVSEEQRIYEIKQFVEKPKKETAEQYIETKNYLWNCGFYMFKVSTMMEEFSNLQPEILSLCKESFERAKKDLDLLRLEKESFLKLPNSSIDHAIIEKTNKGVVIEADIGWCDLGCWEDLWKISSQNKDGNALIGDVFVQDVERSYVRSQNQFISVLGLDDVVVVADHDAILVAKKSYSQEVKEIVKKLKDDNRREHESPMGITHRPWGHYHSIERGEGFQVKKIVVEPQGKLSLQFHYHREEHWFIVQGTAKVILDNQEFLLSKGDTIHIPKGAVHRVENPGELPLQLIEVQLGDYLEEDDIVRLEDIYGRAAQKRVSSLSS